MKKFFRRHAGRLLGYSTQNSEEPNTVAPGPTRNTAAPTRGDSLEQLGSATPLGRTADPTEIAEAIVFPVSPRASYLTGATVAVDLTAAAALHLKDVRKDNRLG